MSQPTIDLTIQNGIAQLTLNRRTAANAMNLELARELIEAALQCDEDPAVRAVVVGRATADVLCRRRPEGIRREGRRAATLLKRSRRYLHKAVSHLTRMDAPVIAAVHGSATGGGMSLACSADWSWRPSTPSSRWRTLAPG